MSRVALVTGAGSGIGRAAAIRLSQAGLQVVLASRAADALAATAEACPGPALAVPADVTDPAAVDRLFDRAEQDWGTVEVLIASAGAGFSARIERTSDADWNRMLELNLTAPFRCLRRAVPAMRERGYGRVVVIASTASRIGEPYLAAYTASKHGVLGLVRAVSAELAGTGVTVNAVCPGFVDTPMTEATIGNIVQRTGRTTGQARSALEARQPIGRLITPGEVADAVLVLRRQRGRHRAGDQRRRGHGSVLTGGWRGHAGHAEYVPADRVVLITTEPTPGRHRVRWLPPGNPHPPRVPGTARPGHSPGRASYCPKPWSSRPPGRPNGLGTRGPASLSRCRRSATRRGETWPPGSGGPRRSCRPARSRTGTRHTCNRASGSGAGHTTDPQGSTLAKPGAAG